MTPGAKAYFLRRILHDFSDPFCVAILSKIVPAMAPDSRILIADLMLPENATANELGIVSFDMTMFNMGGKQRTEACFQQILEEAGCELVKIWKSEIGFGVIVEAKLKGSGDRIVDGPALVPDAAPATVSTVQDSDDAPLEDTNDIVPAAASNGINNERHILPVSDKKPESATNGIENRHDHGIPDDNVDEPEQTEAPEQPTTQQDSQLPVQEVPTSTDQTHDAEQSSLHQPTLPGTQENETHAVATDPDNPPDTKTNGNGDLSASSSVPPVQVPDPTAGSNGVSTSLPISTRHAVVDNGKTHAASDSLTAVNGEVPTPPTEDTSEALPDSGSADLKHDGGSVATHGGFLTKTVETGANTTEADGNGPNTEATEGGAVKPVAEVGGGQ